MKIASAIGLLFVSIGLALAGAYGLMKPDPPEPPPEPFDPPCYSITDTVGREWPSYTAPYLGDLGLYWELDDAWGVITSPIGFWVDKGCLRARGLDIPKLPRTDWSGGN